MTIELKRMKTSQEHSGSSASGYPVLGVLAVLLALAIWNISGNFPPPGSDKLAKLAFVGLLLGPLLAMLFIAAGFFMIQPNQAAVITLFGEYRGSERREGLRWVFPWMGRKKL